MKQFIVLFSTLILAQGLTFEELAFQDEFEKDTQELFVPLMNEYTELKVVMGKLQQYQETQKVYSQHFAERISRVPAHCLPAEIPVTELIASDACANLSASLVKAANLAENVTQWVFSAALTVGQKVYNLVLCAKLNSVEAAKCVVNDLKDLKDTVLAYKTVVEKFKNEVNALSKELKVEFQECLGVRSKTEALARQIVLEAQSCENSFLRMR